jgi:hypothetical protein
VTNFREWIRIRDALERAKCNIFSCFRCNNDDDLLIKFEPVEEFNLEESNKIIEFSYVNSISAQRWCGINVEEWCFILFLSNGDIE